MADRFFKGLRCSAPVYSILMEVERRTASRGGVAANSLKRTMAEQADLVRRKGLWSLSNRTGAAAPSPSAPHIWVGRENHARDIDTFVGAGIEACLDEMRDMGLGPARNVPGEPWHCQELDEARLLRVAKRFEHRPTILDRLRHSPLRPGARTPDVIAVQTWLKRAGLYDGKIAQDVGTYGPVLRRGVVAFQRRVGLKPDGIVGPKTAAAMRRRYGWKRWVKVLRRRRKAKR